jgi:hypothetical protein
MGVIGVIGTTGVISIAPSRGIIGEHLHLEYYIKI